MKSSVSAGRELAVLACVQAHLDGPRGAVVSIANVAAKTGLSACQARCALQRLVRKGALDATRRTHPNGASAENSYRITRAGLALLETAEHAAGCEGRPIPKTQGGTFPARERKRFMKASNPARAVIATALALSCAIGLAGCGGAAPAATVNGTPVAEETVAAYIDDFRATSSLEDDGAWATWLADNGYTPQSVRQEVVDYYVDEELVRQAAHERGVSADAAEVDEAVQKAKEGYESDEAWREALASSHTTEEAYRAQVELSLLKTALADSFAEAAAPDDGQLLERAAGYDGAKRSSCILFAADGADEAQQVRAAVESGEVQFADAADERAADEGAAAGGDRGWDALSPVGEAYAEALAGLEAGEVSEPFETEEGVCLVMCTDEFDIPEGGLTEVGQVPEALLEAARASFESEASDGGYRDWFADFKSKAEIVVNDMPEDASYNVEVPQESE